MTDDRTADLTVMSVAELRQRRDAVRDRGEALSYRRRLLQAQMDIVEQLGVSGPHEDLATLIGLAIADRPSEGAAVARAVALNTHPELSVAPLPTGLGGYEEVELAGLLQTLRAAEAEASSERRTLLDELDELQMILVARYRDSGVNAASLLSGDGA
ncbi:MAG: hypothetical protein ACI9AD_001004 [Nitriliruptoraceae bacterium]|jgi:hypothetical protein